MAELHVAGHSVPTFDGREIVVDTHDQPVRAAVWDLLDAAIARCGALPILAEWDSASPPLATLVAEAARALRGGAAAC